MPPNELYLKGKNKWWDGYSGQAVAVLDDLHPEHAQYLTTHIKDWTDRFAFKAERKNGSLYPTVKQFIITSQFTIEQLFEKPED